MTEPAQTPGEPRVVAADGSYSTDRAAHAADNVASPGTEGVSADTDELVEPEPPSAVQVFGDRLDLARRYVDILAGDGVLRGVIGPRETSRLWSRHVLNSGVVAELLSPGFTVVDIGSGAGLPGIPLAVARPDCRIILVEPLERRVLFLLEVLDMLELTNCRVVRGRAEDVVDSAGGADVVTSRAVAPLAAVARWSAPLLRIGGQMLALKGSSAAAEIERDAAAVRAVGLRDLAVVQVGAGMVEPETIVVKARRSAIPPQRKARASQRTSGVT